MMHRLVKKAANPWQPSPLVADQNFRFSDRMADSGMPGV